MGLLDDLQSEAKKRKEDDLKQDAELKAQFIKVSEALKTNETTIVSELIEAQGTSQDVGGYYKPNEEMVDNAMRPSTTFNSILESI